MTENISFNFGAIRDTITRLSAVELIREQKSVTLDKFLKEIKQSPILTKQQFVFKNIENTKPFTKERLAERFIAQNMQLFKNEKWNDVAAENKRVRKELLDDIHIESRMDNKLAESINTLIEFNTTSNHLDLNKEIEREIEALLSILLDL
jgi:pyruvate carboxylase